MSEGLLRSILSRLRARVHAVLSANLAPRKLFLAVLVGAMVGSTPFYGLHFVLCVALGWALRLNTPAMYAAANISIPPLIPFLGFACVQVGERLLHGDWLPLGVEEFHELVQGEGVRSLMHRFFVDWTAGSVVVGGAIGLGLGSPAYGVARARQARGEGPDEAATPDGAGASAPALSQAVDKAISDASDRYRGAPRNLRWYAFFKYRMDPSYRRIAELVPERSLTVDLGTGLGMLPLVLALLPGEREALGIDWDAPKLAAGRLAATGLDRVRLVEGDARTEAIPPCDAITLVDVLHYYEPAAQAALLSRAVAALREGGQLLVREGDAARSGGAAWTRLLEALAVRVGWNRGDGATKFRGIEALRAELEALGLSVTVEPLAGRLHPGNVLVRGRKG